MPPKRAKLTLPENDEENGGLETLQIGSKKKAAAKTKEKHAAYVIAVDVGSIGNNFNVRMAIRGTSTSVAISERMNNPLCFQSC